MVKKDDTKGSGVVELEVKDKMDYLKNAKVHFDYIRNYCKRNSFRYEKEILDEYFDFEKDEPKMIFRYTTYILHDGHLSDEDVVKMEEPEDLFFIEQFMANTIKRVY